MNGKTCDGENDIVLFELLSPSFQESNNNLINYSMEVVEQRG